MSRRSFALTCLLRWFWYRFLRRLCDDLYLDGKSDLSYTNTFPEILTHMVNSVLIGLSRLLLKSM